MRFYALVSFQQKLAVASITAILPLCIVNEFRLLSI